MNFSSEDMTKGILRDRAKVGASLADIDPMSIDRSVSSYYKFGGQTTLNSDPVTMYSQQ